MSVGDRQPEAGFSEPALVGRVIQSGCRQGQCRWLRVRQVEAVETLPQGQLRRMVVRSGMSLHPGGEIPERPSAARIEWEPSDRVDFAFCSRERPAFAFSSDGEGLIVHFLDLFDLGGYQYSSASLYMRVCHGLKELPDATALRSLGYRAGTRSEQIETDGPEAITRF